MANFTEITDMEKIRSIAEMLLYVDPQPASENLPWLITHPFINTNPMILPGCTARDVQFCDVMTEDGLNEYRENMKKVLPDIPLFQLLMMICKPYRLLFASLVFDSNAISQQDFASIIKEAWKTQEWGGYDRNVSRAKCVKMILSVGRTAMEADDQKMFDELPEHIIVFRGSKKNTKRDICSLSWTTEEEIATWFARRFGSEGYVSKITVPKSSIVCCFANEAEVVLNPSSLRLEDISVTVA